MSDYKTKVFTRILEKPDQELQLPIKADMIVPDSKPDIGRIVKTRVRYDPEEKTLDGSRLHFGGRLVCQVLYASEEDARELHSMEHTVSVDDFMNLDIPEGEGRIRYSVDGDIEDTKATILNSRKLNIQVVLSLHVNVLRYVDSEVVSEMEGIPQLQVRRSTQEVVQMCLDREEKYMVKEEIPVAETAPNIAEILWWEVELVGTEHRILDGKATMKGELLVNILYRGENSEEPAEYVEGHIPFQGLLDAPDIRAGAPARSQLRPSGITVRAVSDEDGENRIFLVETMVECHLQVYDPQEMAVTYDLYAPGWDIEPKRARCPIQALKKQGQQQETINESISIPETYPGALQLFGAAVQPKIDDTYSMDGMIEVEGVLKVQLFYLSSEDRYPIAALQEMVPFSVTLEGGELSEELSLDIRPTVIKATVDLAGSREVRLKAEIRFDMLILHNEEVSVIEDVSARRKEQAEIDAMPSIVIYVVQPGDDLFGIAREFDTTPESIAGLNHLEENRNLPAGRQLLLMKDI